MCVSRMLYPPSDLSNNHKKKRYKKDSEKRSRQHSAEHSRSDGIPARRARARCDHKRKHTQDEGHRRHDDRPKTKTGGVERGVIQRLARRVSLIGKLDDQDRVFSGQPDQCNQPDLKINIIGQPPRPDGQQRSQYSERVSQG